MKLGAGGFVTEEKPTPKRLGSLGKQDTWRERNSGDMRSALIQKLIREGKTPAEIRKELAGFDSHRR